MPGPSLDDGLVTALRALGEPRRLALVRALRESGLRGRRTVLLVSHDADQVARLCDAVVELRAAG